MNKKRVDELIPVAYAKLKHTVTGIADENGKIKDAYRGQIASFGAAITTGSLLSAVAFFCVQGGSEVDRSKLMQVIWLLLDYPDFTRAPTKDIKEGDKIIERGSQIDARKLFDEICRCEDARKARLLKSDIIDAAIAIKLAMNLYHFDNKMRGAAEDDQP